MIYFAPYGTAWTLRGIKLVDRATGQYKASPTIASGDFKIEKDGGTSANLATLPTVEPSGGTSVSLEFSAAEMQCRQAVVTMIDGAGAEWSDDAIHIFTVGDMSAFMPFNFFSGTVAVSTPSQSSLVAAVWGAQRASHQLTGSFGEGVASVKGPVASIGTSGITEGSFAEGAIGALVLNQNAIGADELSQDAANKIADAFLDRVDAIEPGLTPRQQMRLAAAADGGTLSGVQTGTVEIKNAVAGNKARIIANTDENGNRLAVTLDVS